MRILRKLKHIYDWLPVLWQDEDYDYEFVLKLLRFKFKRMRKHFTTCSIIVEAPDVAAELAKVDVLLRNIEEDPKDEWNEHFNLWHVGLEYNEDCKDKERHKDILNRSTKRTVKNWKVLWRYLEANLRNWWC